MNCSHPPTSQIKIREDFPKNTHIIAMKKIMILQKKIQVGIERINLQNEEKMCVLVNNFATFQISEKITKSYLCCGTQIIICFKNTNYLSFAQTYYNHIINYQVSRKKQKKTLKKKELCEKLSCFYKDIYNKFTYFAVQQCHHIFMLQQCELLKFNRKKIILIK